MWCYDDPLRVDSYEREIQRKTGNETIARMVSLYRYLEKNPPRSAADLKQRVFFDKAGVLPVFSESEAASAYYMWIIVHDPTKFRRYVHERMKMQEQTGGGESNQQLMDKIFNKIGSLLAYPVKTFVMDAGFDPMQDTVLGIATRLVNNLLPFILKLVFIVKTFEEDVPITNVILTPILNAYNDSDPKIKAAMVAAVTPLAELLAPVAGLGFLIEIIMFLIVLALTLVNVSVNISRGKFGSAYVSSMGLIPFVGPFLVQGIHTVEGLYDEFIRRKEKLRILPLIGNPIANALNVLET